MSLATELHKQVQTQQGKATCKVAGCTRKAQATQGPYAYLCNVHKGEARERLGEAQQAAAARRKENGANGAGAIEAVAVKRSTVKRQKAPKVTSEVRPDVGKSLAMLVEDLAETVETLNDLQEEMDEMALEIAEEREWARRLSEQISARLG